MKKKLLSLSLALTLCLSFIIPAFAAQTYVPSWLEQGAFLEDATSFAAPFAPVSKGGKWGYTDRLGRMAIAPQYEYALPFSRAHSAAL